MSEEKSYYITSPNDILVLEAWWAYLERKWPRPGPFQGVMLGLKVGPRKPRRWKGVRRYKPSFDAIEFIIEVTACEGFPPEALQKVERYLTAVATREWENRRKEGPGEELSEIEMETLLAEMDMEPVN